MTSSTAPRRPRSRPRPPSRRIRVRECHAVAERVAWGHGVDAVPLQRIRRLHPSAMRCNRVRSAKRPVRSNSSVAAGHHRRVVPPSVAPPPEVVERGVRELVAAHQTLEGPRAGEDVGRIGGSRRAAVFHCAISALPRRTPAAIRRHQIVRDRVLLGSRPSAPPARSGAGPVFRSARCTSRRVVIDQLPYPTRLVIHGRIGRHARGIPSLKCWRPRIASISAQAAGLAARFCAIAASSTPRSRAVVVLLRPAR